MAKKRGHVDKLVRRIEIAFRDVEYPGDDSLVYDNSGYDLECVEIAETFRGKSWKDVSLEILRYNAESLFFFTPEAYRYYLPAYLCASVLFYRQSDMVPHSVASSLTAPKSHDALMDSFLETMSGFSVEQKEVIQAFLEYMSAEHPDTFPNTVRRFWR